MANGDDAPKDIDRFIKDIDRFMKDIDRFMKDIDRGPKDIDRSSDDIVEDVFRRVSNLNGFLVVSFVAPVAGGGQGFRGGGRGPRSLMMSGLARKAEARQQEAALAQQKPKAKK